MTPVKDLLFGSLRIFCFGTLKISLLVYTFFLVDTPAATAFHEGGGATSGSIASARREAKTSGAESPNRDIILLEAETCR